MRKWLKVYAARKYIGCDRRKLSDYVRTARVFVLLNALVDQFDEPALRSGSWLVYFKRPQQQSYLAHQLVFLGTLCTRRQMRLNLQHFIATKALVHVWSNQLLDFMTSHEQKPLCFFIMSAIVALITSIVPYRATEAASRLNCMSRFLRSLRPLCSLERTVPREQFIVWLISS